ncbi:WbqC family protein [Litorivicinus sp.]|nr:WbqC family protein [Litorivicinus sp.]
MKKIAILQSNYIPWKGYFDIIASVDEFIIYDDMQYTRRDWRNRNQVKTPHGLKWLTVPVQSKGNYHQKIKEVEIDGITWQEEHWNTLLHNYRKAPYFSDLAAEIEPLYREQQFINLSDLNYKFISVICSYLRIRTKITNSSQYQLIDGKTERLANLCVQAGGSCYISGPSAKGYIDPSIFQESGIELQWFDYENYGQYPQLWGDFEHAVSILDLLFNCGPNSTQFMKYFCANH